MGRSPCCDKIGLKKGPWTPEEDQKLLAYVEENGHGSWRALPVKAGLQRCGKSCRLRWTNYLRPDIKRGKFSLQEEHTIIQLHALLGNRWSAIATHLSKRTDNEIKNYWNTHLKKRLVKMGIDPVTHKPKKDALLLSGSKNAANLSHMAQWENARLQAEARLVRQSKLRSESFQPHNSEFPSVSSPPHKPVGPNPNLDIWTGAGASFGASMAGICADLESPTSTVCSAAFAGEGGVLREETREKDLNRLATSLRDGIENSIQFPAELNHETPFLAEWRSESMRGSNSEHVPCGNFVENFTDLLLSTSSAERRQSDDGGESDDGGGDYEGNKNYWDSILNLVNSSPSDSPIF